MENCTFSTHYMPCFKDPLWQQCGVLFWGNYYYNILQISQPHCSILVASNWQGFLPHRPRGWIFDQLGMLIKHSLNILVLVIDPRPLCGVCFSPQQTTSQTSLSLDGRLLSVDPFSCRPYFFPFPFLYFSSVNRISLGLGSRLL